jgi:predicted dinucleotide-binding enzyme
MNIGIIGSGNVGGTLGTRWSALGHRVVFSSGNPQSDEMRKLVQEAGPGASAATVAEAVRASDVPLVAAPSPATRQAVQGAGDSSGKVLIDATNPTCEGLGASLDQLRLHALQDFRRRRWSKSGL